MPHLFLDPHVLYTHRLEEQLHILLDDSYALSSELSVATVIPGRAMVTAMWPDALNNEAWLDNRCGRESGA